MAYLKICKTKLGNIEEFMAEQAYHPYHLVDPSPWPLVGACGAFFTTVGGVMYFHYSQSGLLVLGLVLIIGTMVVW